MTDIVPGRKNEEVGVYILNAFSLNMIADGSFPCAATFKEISVDEARVRAVEADSAVGHPDTAAIFAEALSRDVPVNRVTVALNKGDTTLVGQYRGPRLPEGVKTLPPGATIKWYLVAVE